MLVRAVDPALTFTWKDSYSFFAAVSATAAFPRSVDVGRSSAIESKVSTLEPSGLATPGASSRGALLRCDPLQATRPRIAIAIATVDRLALDIADARHATGVSRKGRRSVCDAVGLVVRMCPRAH